MDIRQATKAGSIVEQFATARFGYFNRDGRFVEFPPDPKWSSHPDADKARWVGGKHDAELLRAAFAQLLTD